MSSKIVPFSPQKKLRNVSYRRNVYDLFYNNVVCRYKQSGLKEKWKKGKYCQILKAVSDYQFIAIPDHYGPTNQNLKRVYKDYVNTLTVKTNDGGKQFLLVYDKRDVKNVVFFIENVKNIRLLKEQVIIISNIRKENKILRKRLREVNGKLKLSVKNAKKLKRKVIDLEKIEKKFREFNKKRLVSKKFLLSLIDAIGNCESVKPVVTLFSNQYPEMKLSSYGSSPRNCGRLLIQDANERRESVTRMLMYEYVALIHDHGNKKGNVHSVTFSVICRGNNKHVPIVCLENYERKEFQLPLSAPLDKKGETTHAYIVTCNETLECNLYMAITDGAKDMKKVHSLMINDTNNQIWRVVGSVHKYNSAVLHIILYSFRAKKKKGKKYENTDVYSSYYSTFTTELYNCFEIINCNFKQWKSLYPSLTACAFVQTRIGKNFPSSRKLLRFVKYFLENEDFRSKVKEDVSTKKLTSGIGNPEFRKELFVLCSVGSLTLESVYFTCQSFDGSNAPILRIKICQAITFAKMIAEGNYTREIYDWFYLNNANDPKKNYFLVDYDLELVAKMKTFASECYDFLIEYFADWLFDLNCQIALIWNKTYAQKLDNFIEGIKHSDPDSLTPFFGFHFSDEITTSFQSYINSDADITEFPVLLDWYAKLFFQPTNQIKSERILGRVNYFRMTKPSLSFKMLDVHIFRKYTTMNGKEEIVNIPNIRGIFEKLSEDDKEWYCDSFLNSQQGDCFAFAPLTTNNDKVFFYNICDNEESFKSEIGRVIVLLLQNKPNLQFWIDTFKTFQF